MPHYFRNVDFIIKDWKEAWEGDDITKLIHSMPRDNVIETVTGIEIDNDVMISCPLALVNQLRDANSDLSIWIYDYGVYDEYDGFYWDGEELQVIYKGKLISQEEWEKIVERILE